MDTFRGNSIGRRQHVPQGALRGDRRGPGVGAGGWFILPGNGFTAAHGFGPLSLGDGPTLRAVAGSVLYLALIALLSLGLATALRDSSAAIAVVLGAWTTAALLHAGVWR